MKMEPEAKELKVAQNNYEEVMWTNKIKIKMNKIFSMTLKK
jgi:hypothetical protein